MADLQRKTANLFNKATALANTAISDIRGNTFSSNGLNGSDYINVSGMNIVSITNTLACRWGAFYDTNKVFVSGFNGYGTINVPQNAAYMRITVTDAFLDSCMVNEGNSLLPYEPYGWVHSLRKQCSATETIQSGDTIYANGQPISTYSIKGNTVQDGVPTPSNPIYPQGCGDLVTEGEHAGQYKIPISNGQQTIDIYIGDLPLLKSLDDTAVDEISNGTLIRRVDADGSVLPTPTTTQITMPSITTTDGANSIAVDTTVQPSEFSATWTGWHDSSVQEYQGGVGNQKFDHQRTEGLLLQQYINQAGQTVVNVSYNMSYLIPVTPNATYMWNFASTVQHKAPTVAFYDSNGDYISVATHSSTTAFSFDTPINCAYIRVPIYTANKAAAMLNEGSTVLPYEPYEYGWV